MQVCCSLWQALLFYGAIDISFFFLYSSRLHTRNGCVEEFVRLRKIFPDQVWEFQKKYISLQAEQITKDGKG